MPRRTPKVRRKPTAKDDGIEWDICVVDQCKFLTLNYPQPIPDVPADVLERGKAEKLPLKPGRYALVFWWTGDRWFTFQEWTPVMLPRTPEEEELRERYIVQKPSLEDMFPDLETASNDTTTEDTAPVCTPGGDVVEDTPTPDKPTLVVERQPQIISGGRSRRDERMPWSERV